jgi:cytochrome c oxidase assembly factor CtaG
MLPGAIAAASSNGLARIGVLAITVLTGIVLWLPVIDRVPGVTRLPLMGKAGYLFAQSIAPTFLSFAWIFASRPLYGSLHGQAAAVGLSPLADQQAAAYLSKLGTFGVLWTVAFILFSRAGDGEDVEEPQLHWADVERALERADRRRRPTKEAEG